MNLIERTILKMKLKVIFSGAPKIALFPV